MEGSDHNENVFPLALEITDDSVRVIEDSTLTDSGSITRFYTEKDSSSLLRKWVLVNRFTFERKLGRTELRVPAGSIRQRN